MHPEMFTVKCSIIRGGTSKGVYIMANELPADAIKRDNYIREIFGSPDLRQIDGLGGADVLTSKVCIIGPSSRPDADVDYIFAQVSFADEVIDYKSNCGNLSAGVGPFAVDNGLVAAVEPVTTVRIHQVNTDSIIVASFPVTGGRAKVTGDEHIDGVPVDGASVELDFSDSAGGITGKLLPTGNVTDEIITGDGKSYTITMLDAGIPTVFALASDLGMTGIETPAEIEGNTVLMDKIEEIRSRCAVIMGILDDWNSGRAKSSYTPFFACVSPSVDYVTFDGKQVAGSEIDLVSRLVFMQRMHKTHPVTGTICMGAAARVPGSIVNRVLSEKGKNNRRLVIGHPAGVIPVVSEMEEQNGQFILKNASILRTARLIMEGQVYLRYTRV